MYRRRSYFYQRAVQAVSKRQGFTHHRLPPAEAGIHRGGNRSAPPVHAGGSLQGVRKSRPQEGQKRVPTLPAKAGSKKLRELPKGHQRCRDCGASSAHLKRHVFQLHISPRWWQIQPLMACWACRCYKAKDHVLECGPYQARYHVHELAIGIEQFHLASDSALIEFVRQNKLAAVTSNFTVPEMEVLDSYDHLVGQGYIRVRASAIPDRISSLLHWKTIRNILKKCGEIHVLPHRIREVNERPLIKASKMRITISGQGRKILDERVVREPVAEKPVPTVLLPGEREVCEPFFDTHCHLDRLYSRYGFRGTLQQFLKERHRPALSSFRGCLTVFCDPDFYQRNDSEVLRILKEAMVFGAVGCHPGQAYRYSSQTGRALESLLRHPKIIAIGEMGLDFSFHHLKKNPKHLQREVLERQLVLAALVAKPVIFHQRECDNEVLVAAKKHLPRYTKIHVHSCKLSWSQMMAWIRSFPNSYFGITSAITHEEEEEVREVAVCAPLHRLVTETDAPYFLPKLVPSSQRNSPADL